MSVNIPYNLLSDDQQKMVELYVKWQLTQLDPNQKIRPAEFKHQARLALCTTDGIKKLEAMQEKGEEPFVVMEEPPKPKFTELYKRGSGETNDAFLKLHMRPEQYASYKKAISHPEHTGAEENNPKTNKDSGRKK